MITLELSTEQAAELERLLYVAMMKEADRMHQQGAENCLFLIKKLKEPNKLKDITE